MMTVDDLGNDGQAQSHSALLRGHEWIEYLLPQVRRDSWPGIGNTYFYSVDRVSITGVAARGVDLNTQHSAAFGAHRVIRVLNDIYERLFRECLIERNLRQAGLILLFHLYRRPFPELRDIIQRSIQHCGDITRRQVRMQRTREIEKAGDQGAQPVR